MPTATKTLLHTPLCDLLGLRYPICQAGMGFVARSALAAAVSEAGGLGVLAAAHNTPEELRADPSPFHRSHNGVMLTGVCRQRLVAADLDKSWERQENRRRLLEVSEWDMPISILNS